MRYAIRKSREEDAKAKKTRAAKLKQERERRNETIDQAKLRGAIERARIRAEAERILEHEEGQRYRARDHYNWTMGTGWGLGKGSQSRHKGKRYSAAESDSLAESNIEDQYLGLWRKNKDLFPRSLEPDHRAEVFMEWIQEHPEAISEHWASLQDEQTDDQLAKAYALYLHEEELTQQYADAVPF